VVYHRSDRHPAIIGDAAIFRDQERERTVAGSMLELHRKIARFYLAIFSKCSRSFDLPLND